MPATDQINIEPIPSNLESESSRPSLDMDSGPVVASTEYRVAPRNVRAFLAAASRLQRMRRRNGARRWALLRDATDPEVWIERFETPTWLDHLRVRERMTVVDREVEDRILSYHQGEGRPSPAICWPTCQSPAAKMRQTCATPGPRFSIRTCRRPCLPSDQRRRASTNRWAGVLHKVSNRAWRVRVDGHADHRHRPGPNRHRSRFCG